MLSAAALTYVAAAAAVLVWIAKIMRAALADTLDLQYTGFVASHIVIFLVAYVAMEDVNTGWLAINVWHNFQYVLVVWMSNAKRYAGGIDPAARFLSRLSQPGRVMKYFACCLAITTLVYAAIDRLTVLALGGGLAMARHGWETQLGPGRHPISSALFWYFKSPAGGLAEYFADEDVLTENWQPRDFTPSPQMFAEWAVVGGIDGNTRRQKQGA